MKPNDPVWTSDVCAETPNSTATLTLADVWSQILQHRQELTKLIDSRKLGDMEVPAAKIASSARKLPAMSGMLSPGKIAALKPLIQKVQRSSEDLDTTGDENNLAATEANVRKLDDALQSIAALYPAGTLSTQPSSSAEISVMPSHL